MLDAMLPDKDSIKVRLLLLVGVIVVLLTLGTFFYHRVEGWSYIDSFYFSSISLSTRGYGELHPSNASSKIFTVFYLFLGVAFILYTMSNLLSYFIQYHEPKIRKKMDTIVKRMSPTKHERWVTINMPKEDNKEE
jgi:hypothetical protein